MEYARLGHDYRHPCPAGTLAVNFAGRMHCMPVNKGMQGASLGGVPMWIPLVGAAALAFWFFRK